MGLPHAHFSRFTQNRDHTMNHRSLEQRAIDKAIKDVEQYGDTPHTMIFARYVNESGELDIRPFQWARRESRIEFDRLVGWCLKRERTIHVLPYSHILANA